MWIFVTKDDNELEHQQLDPRQPDADKWKLYALQAAAGFLWFFNTFDVPVRIWGA